MSPVFLPRGVGRDGAVRNSDRPIATLTLGLLTQGGFIEVSTFRRATPRGGALYWGPGRLGEVKYFGAIRVSTHMWALARGAVDRDDVGASRPSVGAPCDAIRGASADE